MKLLTSAIVSTLVLTVNADPLIQAIGWCYSSQHPGCCSIFPWLPYCSTPTSSPVSAPTPFVGGGGTGPLPNNDLRVLQGADHMVDEWEDWKEDTPDNDDRRVLWRSSEDKWNPMKPKRQLLQKPHPPEKHTNSGRLLGEIQMKPKRQLIQQQQRPHKPSPPPTDDRRVLEGVQDEKFNPMKPKRQLLRQKQHPQMPSLPPTST